MSQVSYGTITITDLNDIEEIYTIYAGSNTENSPTFTYAAVTDGTTWKRNASALSGFKYIWQSTVVTKSGVIINSTNWQEFYSQPVRLTGLEGNDADNISAIETQYCNYGEGTPTASANWQSTTPEYDSSKPNYWSRTRLKYDTNPVTYSSWSNPIKDQALTDAIYNAVMANSIATHANENAQGAMSQASATQIAQEALASKLKYIWINETGTATYPVGTYAASSREDETPSIPFNSSDSSTYGFNSLLRHTYLSFRYNAHQLVTIGTGIATDSGGISGIAINTPIIDNNNKIANVAKGVELTSNNLTFYHSPTIVGTTVTSGNKAMELTDSALNFFGSSLLMPDASLTSTGLTVSTGGIKGGHAGGSNFIYLSTEDYPLRRHEKTSDTAIDINKTYYILESQDNNYYYNAVTNPIVSEINNYYEITQDGYTINNYTPNEADANIGKSEPDAGWREIIGDKFGIDSNGILYASGANISGNFVVEADSDSNIYTKDEVNASLSLKIDQAVDGTTDLISNINAVADQISLMASQINFGNNMTVADELTTLNSAISIDTVNKTIRIGSTEDFYMLLTPVQLGFYKVGISTDTPVAFMQSDRLYIENNLSFGHFIFTERDNGHFTLKRID